ncbi:MAG: winged helix-turn-helix domain-containing protein [Thermoplasmatales archaeon]
MTIWYCHKNPYPDLNFDPTEMINFLENNPEAQFHAQYTSNINPGIIYMGQTKTIQKAIKNGFAKLDLWMYTNKVKSIYDTRRKVHLPPQIQDNNYNWSVDMDKTKFNDIKDLLEYLYIQDVPIPEFISHTSPGSFHLRYVGPRRLWSEDNIMKVHYMIAGADHIPSTEEGKQKMLSSVGIDYFYAKQDRVRSKIRVPGSVNSKVKDYVFVVRGWKNPDYDIQKIITQLKNSKISSVIPFPSRSQRRSLVAKNSIKTFKKFRSKTKFLLEACRKAIKINKDPEGKKINTIVELILANMKRLNDGCAYISQLKWAKILGISQPTVSRILKQLQKAGILRIVDPSYNCDTYEPRAMVYGFTAEFKAVLRAYGRRKFNEDTTLEPYENGRTYAQMKSDIKTLYLDVGKTPDEIIEFIYNKNLMRPPEKQRLRNRKQIQSMVYNTCHLYRIHIIEKRVYNVSS